jgi:hypothetical protein
MSTLPGLILRVLLVITAGGLGSLDVPSLAKTSACLQNLAVNSATSTTANLSWEFRCERTNLKLYKVHYSHERYMSCPDGRKDLSRPSGFGTVESPSEHIVLKDLHPYSEYSVELRAILRTATGGGRPETLKTSLRTEYSLPRVRPAESSLDNTLKWTATELVFNWSPPLAASLCDDFNSDLGYYFYKVGGVSPWNRHYQKEDNLSLTDTMLTLTDLTPYSEYVLFVYVTNTAGEFDEDVYMKLEGQTLPGPPRPPRDLLLLPSSHQGTLHLQWRAPYPPTGEGCSRICGVQ